MRFDSWALCKSRNLSNSARRRDQISVWICIIHFKSGLSIWKMKSIFHEWIHYSVSEVNAWTDLIVNRYENHCTTASPWSIATVNKHRQWYTARTDSSNVKRHSLKLALWSANPNFPVFVLKSLREMILRVSHGMVYEKTNKQSNKQTNKQTNKQANKQTNILVWDRARHK